jgi:hypothetical protein
MSPRSKSSQVDLSKLFNTVTKTLKKNQAALNAADEANHNHGDNMVKSFQVITKATKEMKGSTPAEQLAHAGKLLAQQAPSGSAQLYVDGLTRAARELRGSKAITPENALVLVQALLGGKSAGGSSADGKDLIDQILTTLMQGQQDTSRPKQQSKDAGEIDINVLLVAGIAYFQARKKGLAPTEAIIQALLAGSQMLNITHRAQSGQLVAESLLNSLSATLAK